jgi:hypothetical protein
MSESDAEQKVEPGKEGRDRRIESQKGKKIGEIGEQLRKEDMRLHSEKRACPRRGNSNSS